VLQKFKSVKKLVERKATRIDTSRAKSKEAMYSKCCKGVRSWGRASKFGQSKKEKIETIGGRV
jgi:hypothetical protein